MRGTIHPALIIIRMYIKKRITHLYKYKHLQDIANVNFFTKLIFIVVYLYVTAISFATTSLWPRIMDAVFPLNTSRPIMLMWQAYYFVDEEKYYNYIFCDMLIILMICLAALIAHDTMFFIYIEHVCGLFAVIG